MSRNVAQVSSSGRQMSRHVADILVRRGEANVEKNVTTSVLRATDALPTQDLDGVEARFQTGVKPVLCL